MKKKIYAVPAPIWKRVIAFIIDLLAIEFLFVAPFQSVFMQIMPIGKSYFETIEIIQKTNLKTLTIILFAITILTQLYFIISEYKLGQTLGKLVMDLHIVADKKIYLWQIIVSNLMFIPFFPFILLTFIDPIYALISNDNLRLTEKWAKLKVVELHAL